MEEATRIKRKIRESNQTEETANSKLQDNSQ